MLRLKIILALTFMTGCAAQVEPSEPGIPSSCFEHSAKDFMSSTLACDPKTADTCAFNAHNEPTQLDQSGGPLSYYCMCSEPGRYSCWGSPGFVAAEPFQ